MRLRDRLTWSLVSFGSIGLLVSFTAAYLLVERDELREMDRLLLSEGQHARDVAVQANPSRPAPVGGTTRIAEGPMAVRQYAVTYDRDGNLIGATSQFRGAAPTLAELGGRRDEEGRLREIRNGETLLRGVFLNLPDSGGTLFFAGSRGYIDDDLRFLREVFAAIFALYVLGSVLAARGIGRHLASEVDALASVTRSASEGDLSRRAGGRFSTEETRSLAVDLDHMMTRLDELLTAQRIFISHASHELRSPLATIRGELQLALRRPRDEQEYRRMIEESLIEVERLCLLAEDLLTLARSQAKPQISGRARAKDIVSEAVRMARAQADELGVGIVSELDALEEAVVECGRTDVARALRNLIDNAASHSREGTSVKIHGSVVEGFVYLSVDDQGEGVSPADRPAIFEPFFRSAKEQAGSHPGVGLGLSIARSIARSHGGEVTLADKESPGACFVLSLPTAIA